LHLTPCLLPGRIYACKSQRGLLGQKPNVKFVVHLHYRADLKRLKSQADQV
jgi:hypothetical protein